ncbi:hypothetical protein EV182_000849 [Spiromyces aspiralis]|uniref:Uncharacterized protein n=1 Tax=Spiromyces aspiralis TaxID=68401 RepID=A0ACC1HUC0_9FUNG|nr:hypothetical protein EV182_000849 [Spiromyces aspiralis]
MAGEDASEFDDQRISELYALKAIYDDEFTYHAENGTISGSWWIRPELTGGLTVPAQVGQELRDVPPICLEFSLDKGHPVDRTPYIRIRCNWLDEGSRNKLRDHLAALWAESDGMSALTVCGEEVRYVIMDCQDRAREDEYPYQWESTFGDPYPRNALEYCLTYERYVRHQEFRASRHGCGICMEEKPGVDCYRFDDSGCGHVFCRSCLADYYLALIEDGTVEGVRCPHSSCRSNGDKGRCLPSAVLGELLGTKKEGMAMVKRYECLLEKLMVDRDPTSWAWCPRPDCQNPARRDGSIEKLAMCSSCHYVFCVYCQKTWHGTNMPCKIGDKSSLAKRYLDAEERGDSALVRELELRYSKKVLLRLKQEYLDEQETQRWIYQNATECPSCDLAVLKSDGCNHMQCQACNTHFCYLCGSYLDKSNPYEHFSSPTSQCYQLLFQGILADGGNISDSYGGLVADMTFQVLRVIGVLPFHGDPISACVFASCPQCMHKVSASTLDHGCESNDNKQSYDSEDASWHCRHCGWVKDGQKQGGIKWRYRLRLLVSYKQAEVEVVVFGASAYDMFGCSEVQWIEWVMAQRERPGYDSGVLWYQLRRYFGGEWFGMSLVRSKRGAAEQRKVLSYHEEREGRGRLKFEAKRWRRIRKHALLQFLDDESVKKSPARTTGVAVTTDDPLNSAQHAERGQSHSHPYIRDAVGEEEPLDSDRILEAWWQCIEPPSPKPALFPPLDPTADLEDTQFDTLADDASSQNALYDLIDKLERAELFATKKAGDEVPTVDDLVQAMGALTSPSRGEKPMKAAIGVGGIHTGSWGSRPRSAGGQECDLPSEHGKAGAAEFSVDSQETLAEEAACDNRRAKVSHPQELSGAVSIGPCDAPSGGHGRQDATPAVSRPLRGGLGNPKGIAKGIMANMARRPPT